MNLEPQNSRRSFPFFSERSDKAPAPRAGVWGWGNVVVHCTPKQERPPHREAFLVLGCSDYVFSNSFLEDLERLWELRSIIPDPCNPNIVVNEKNDGKVPPLGCVSLKNKQTPIKGKCLLYLFLTVINPNDWYKGTKSFQSSNICRDFYLESRRFWAFLPWLG